MPTTNIFPSFTPSVHTNGDLANKANFDAVDAPQNNFISAIDDLRDLGVLTSNTVLVQNRDIMAAMDAASGNRSFTLPAATGQRFPITLKKVDTSSNTVTINRAGSDTIEDPTNPLLSPTATSFVLRLPDEAITLYPFGTTQWRVVKHYKPNRIYAAAYQTSPQALTVAANETLVNFQNDSTPPFGADPYGFFDISTNRFTPLMPGRYLITSTIGFQSGSSAYGFISIDRNGSRVALSDYSPALATTSFFQHQATAVAIMNGSTDYIEIYARVYTNNRTLASASVNFDYLGIS